MRVVLAFTIVAGALALSLPASGATRSGTFLRVTYWADGTKTSPTAVWKLSCNPPRGTLPRPAVACKKLAAGGWKLLAPIPPDTLCTQIYGGPQRARVVGRVAGRRIWVTFQRKDGCQIGRWNQVSPWLLPPGGVTR